MTKAKFAVNHFWQRLINMNNGWYIWWFDKIEYKMHFFFHENDQQEDYFEVSQNMTIEVGQLVPICPYLKPDIKVQLRC